MSVLGGEEAVVYLDKPYRRLSELTVTDLKRELQLRGLPQTGTKKVLRSCMEQALDFEGIDPKTHLFNMVSKASKRVPNSSDESDFTGKLQAKINRRRQTVEQTTDRKLLAEELFIKEENTADSSSEMDFQFDVKEEDSEAASTSTKETSTINILNKMCSTVTKANSDTSGEYVFSLNGSEDDEEASDDQMADGNSQAAGDNQTTDADGAAGDEEAVGDDEPPYDNDEPSEDNDAAEDNDKPTDGNEVADTTSAAAAAIPSSPVDDMEHTTSTASGVAAQAVTANDGGDGILPIPSTGNPRLLWISNIPRTTRANQLKESLGSYGKVKWAKVVVNAHFPGSCCFGYVTMGSAEDAENVIKSLDNTEFQGQIIKVEIFDNKKVDEEIASAGRNDISQSIPSTSGGNIRSSPTTSEIINTVLTIKDRLESHTVTIVRDKGENNNNNNDNPSTGKNMNKKDPCRFSRGRSDTERRRSRVSDRPSRGRTRRSNSTERSARSHSRKTNHDVLTFDRIRDERNRQKRRDRERALREETRRQREEDERALTLERTERRQRIEAERLDRERERIHLERVRIEHERSELLKLEREVQRVERERLEISRIEMQRTAALRMEENRRAEKRPAPPQLMNYRRDEMTSFDDRRKEQQQQRSSDSSRFSDTTIQSNRFNPPARSSEISSSKKFASNKDFKARSSFDSKHHGTFINKQRSNNNFDLCDGPPTSRTSRQLGGNNRPGTSVSSPTLLNYNRPFNILSERESRAEVNASILPQRSLSSAGKSAKNSRFVERDRSPHYHHHHHDQSSSSSMRDDRHDTRRNIITQNKPETSRHYSDSNRFSDHRTSGSNNHGWDIPTRSSVAAATATSAASSSKQYSSSKSSSSSWTPNKEIWRSEHGTPRWSSHRNDSPACPAPPGMNTSYANRYNDY